MMRQMDTQRGKRVGRKHWHTYWTNAYVLPQLAQLELVSFNLEVGMSPLAC